MVFIDFETASDVDLKKAGVYEYARHESTRITSLAFSVGGVMFSGKASVHKAVQLQKEGEIFVAHNAQFDRLIWDNVVVRDFDADQIPASRWRCTMARCYQLGIPASLAKACEFLDLSVRKDDEGGKAMMRIAKGKSDSKEDWAAMEKYVQIDIEALMALYDRIGLLDGDEQKVWVLDQGINDRGVQVDLNLAKSCIAMVGYEKDRLTSEFNLLTGVSSPMSRIKYKSWLKSRDVVVEDTKKDTLLPLIGTNIPPDVEEAIRIGALISKASTAKYATMMNWGASDGRIRGVHQYHAATTGRWGGRGVQLQNLPRGFGDERTQSNVISLMKREDAEEVEIFGGVMQSASDVIRGGLMAMKGHEFVICDFDQIEARVLAWCAGDTQTIDIFRSDRDVYKDAAAGIYKIPYSEVTKDERFVGKVATLALGYQGWTGAFSAMADAYGLNVSEEEAMEIAGSWREAHPETVGMWKQLEKDAVEAVAYGRTIKRDKYAMGKVKGDFKMRLPSGRVLSYPKAHIDTNKKGRLAVHFDGYFKPGRWGICSTYGGKLTENLVQAISADILRGALMRLKDKEHRTVFHVHDEVVIEARKGSVDVSEMEDIMNVVPSWGTGIPIECGGFKATRYRK